MHTTTFILPHFYLHNTHAILPAFMHTVSSPRPTSLPTRLFQYPANPLPWLLFYFSCMHGHISYPFLSLPVFTLLIPILSIYHILLCHSSLSTQTHLLPMRMGVIHPWPHSTTKSSLLTQTFFHSLLCACSPYACLFSILTSSTLGGSTPKDV